MRTAASFLLLLVSCLLPAAAHADPLDQFSIVGGGQDIEFALPASTTVPDSLFGQSYAFQPLAGTVNGSPATVDVQFIFPGLCADCDTIELTTVINGNYNTLFIGLPDLYAITYPGTNQVNLSFLPNAYTAPTEYPHGGPTYTIDVTPQATATTPEPPSLLLLATAALGSLIPLRRRLLPIRTEPG